MFNDEFIMLFNSDRIFGNISDEEMLKVIARCDKLKNWLEKDSKKKDILDYMSFSYWLGVIDSRREE